MLHLDAQEWRRFDRVRRCVDDHAPRPSAEVDDLPPRDPDWRRRARFWGLRRMARRWGLLAVVAAVISGVVVAAAIMDPAVPREIVVISRAIPIVVILAVALRSGRNKAG